MARGMHLRSLSVCRAVLAFVAIPCLVSATGSNEMSLQRALVIQSAGRAARSAVHTDAVEAQIVSGQWRPPRLGEVLTGQSGPERKWEHAEANPEGWLAPAGLRGGYVYWPVVSPEDKVMLLEAAGHNLAYVNGQIRAGDPYANGYVRLPVQLRAGTNDLLFQCSRGRLRAKLIPVSAPFTLDLADATLPDVRVGEVEAAWGAVVAINATTSSMTVGLRAKGAKSPARTVELPALGVFKVPFLVQLPRLKAPGKYQAALELTDARGRTVLARAEVTLRVRRPEESYKRTFLSSIDDSVQYFAVNPASGGAQFPPGEALFLSLHGAGVEAIGQADAYSPKTWGHLVCPTNRRPYGFDWEDWGRLDALEVLALAQQWLHTDPARVYLTGHSMGGHGTWQLGALFPDRFAAIAPSAGWISFTSYVETNRTASTNAVQQIMRRAAAASDTLLMASNYLQEGVYILHGDADDNVPVRQAREMRRVLSGFHHDFDYHEQPGAGHWWDASDENGADCVDWAPLFDFFARHAVPADQAVREVRFTTVNPAVSARSHWVTVAAQQHALEPSTVQIRCDPGKRRLVGTTTNVARLWLGLDGLAPGKPFAAQMDGQKLDGIPWPDGARKKPKWPALTERAGIWLARVDDQWRVAEAPPREWKNPTRSGPFRQAFANHVVLVYGTQGTAEENAWAFAKARYDSETFWYRGNASLRILSDRAFLALDPVKSGKRDPSPAANVILYGHAEANLAWPALLGKSAIQVHRGSLRAGGRELTGDDLACLFLQPHPRDARALIGVVAGTGLPGLRLAERLPYFLSGAGFPDCLVVGTDMLSKGIGGVRAAGFFDNDWQVGTGDFAWRE